MRIHPFAWDFSSTAETVVGILLVGAVVVGILFV